MLYKNILYIVTYIYIYIHTYTSLSLSLSLSLYLFLQEFGWAVDITCTFMYTCMSVCSIAYFKELLASILPQNSTHTKETDETLIINQRNHHNKQHANTNSPEPSLCNFSHVCSYQRQPQRSPRDLGMLSKTSLLLTLSPLKWLTWGTYLNHVKDGSRVEVAFFGLLEHPQQ